jgi:hypothetical protein
MPELPIKQLSQFQKGRGVDNGAVTGPDDGTNSFIKHPRGNPASRFIRQSNVDDVSVSARTSKHFEVLSVEGVIRVKNPPRSSDVGSVLRASWSATTAQSRRSRAP